MNHDEIFTYVLAKYNIALGVDDINTIVTYNLNVDQYVDINKIKKLPAKEAAELVKGGVEGLGNIGDAISDVAKNADLLHGKN